MYAHKTLVIFLTIGAFLCLTGLISYLCFPYIFNALLKQQIALRNGTVGYEIWSSLPIPIYQRLYFFNITNPDEFMRKGEKPNLVEVGPYTFKAHWRKEDVRWHGNNTVSAREVRTFIFLRNESIGSQDDIVTTLNGPLLLGANVLKDYPLSIRLSASLALGLIGERLVVRKSIKQLAFDGYRDVIIALAPFIKKDIPFKQGLFAWLYGKNDTDDGVFNVFTGEDTLDNLNLIDRWNGNKYLNLWKGKTCNMINGSNAEISPPLKPYQDTFTFFQSIFCRSLSLSYSGDVEHLGIGARRFKTTEMTFANKSQNPDNYCFDARLASGVQDISACQYGAPVVLSFPHFYLADARYVAGVRGLSPNRTLHDFHVDVEPYTGLSIDAKVRFQVNLHVQKISGISQLQGISKNVMFPIFWVELAFTVSEELSEVFHSKVSSPRKLAFSLIFGAIGVGAAILLFAALAMLSARQKTTKNNPDSPTERTPLLN